MGFISGAISVLHTQMPPIQFEASRRIRSLTDRDKADVPIIAISASSLQTDIERSLEAGMNAHLSKPIDAESLASYVTRWVQPAIGKMA